ncbi:MULTISPECIES: substrate-binding domain-containing protein [unclassified Microbacterium]|uniref:substrate-binding domain-containing protein n=1 Tax=unclassified Microbacterium TaxID=2609290 RepID=UPI0036552815
MHLFSALAVQRALEEVIPVFETEHNVEVIATFEPTAVLESKLRSGEGADAVIGIRSTLEALGKDDLLVSQSVAALVRSGIGVAVPAGASHPNIGDTRGLTNALTRARAVAYSRKGASGIYFAGLLKKLGIADEVNARAVIPERGFVAEALLDGRADIAIQQLSELASVTGIETVGPLPDGAQQYLELAVGLSVGGNAAQFDAFRAYLFSPRVFEAFRRSGLEPVTT